MNPKNFFYYSNYNNSKTPCAVTFITVDFFPLTMFTQKHKTDYVMLICIITFVIDLSQIDSNPLFTFAFVLLFFLSRVLRE